MTHPPSPIKLTTWLYIPEVRDTTKKRGKHARLLSTRGNVRNKTERGNVNAEKRKAGKKYSRLQLHNFTSLHTAAWRTGQIPSQNTPGVPNKNYTSTMQKLCVKAAVDTIVQGYLFR